MELHADQALRFEGGWQAYEPEQLFLFQTYLHNIREAPAIHSKQMENENTLGTEALLRDVSS